MLIPTKLKCLPVCTFYKSLGSTVCSGNFRIQIKPSHHKLRKSRSNKNNTITAERAVDEFGISVTDLEALTPELLRSPYIDGQYIKVYLEHDIIDIARKTRFKIAKKYDGVQGYKNRENKRMKTRFNPETEKSNDSGAEETVIWSLAGNGILFVLKSGAAINCGSSSMVSEAIHSFTDTLNQAVLYYGVQASKKAPTVEHPYGHQNIKYISSLVSGVGIFCLGSGVSIWQGVTTLSSPQILVETEIVWAYYVLALSFGLEAIVLSKAILTAKENSIKRKISLREHIRSGQDPHTNVVLLEDTVAVGGCVVAACCMYMTTLTGSHVWDAMGSIIIGLGLGRVALFLVSTNSKYLIGQSISHAKVLQIQDELEERSTVKAIYDVKATYLGPDVVRLKAEVQFDGRQIAENYLTKYEDEQLKNEFESISSLSEDQILDAFKEMIIDHVDGAIDDLGKEIDSIEHDLKHKYPEIKHVDLEQN